jgi:hypothetical protein
MAERKETIVIEVVATEQRLGEVAESIARLRQENQKTRTELKNGTKDWATGTRAIKENEAQIKSLQAAEKQLTGQLAIATAENRAYGDSNIELRAQLGDLERQYNSLTAAQKNSEGGVALFNRLTKLKAEVKANAEAMGNYQDSVGDYRNQIISASNSISAMREQLKGLNATLETLDIDSQEFKDTKATIDNLSLAVDQASGKVDEFGNREPKNIAKRQFEDTLITVSILSGTIGALSQAFSENENVQEALIKTQQALVVTQSIANVVKEKGAIIDTVVLVKEKALAASKIVLTNLMRIFGLTSAQAWAVATLGLSVLITGIVLLISNIDKVIANIKKFFGITDQFKEVRTDIDAATKALEGFDDQTKLVTDRLKAQGATEQALLNFRRNRFLQQLKLERELFQKLSKLGSSATDEEKERLKQAAEFIRTNKLALFNFETEQIALTRKLNEEAAKRQRERAANEKQDIERRKKEAEAAAKEVERINKEAQDKLEAQQKEALDRKINRIRSLIEVAEKGSLNELSLRTQLIDKLREQELRDAEKTGADKEAIKKKYLRQEEDAERQVLKSLADEKKRIIDNEFETIRLGLEARSAQAVEFANLELMQAQEQANALNEIGREQFETQSEYDAAMIASKKRVQDATRAVQEAERLQFESQVAALQGFGDVISSVLSELAGDSKEALVFQKFIALAQVSLELAKSIAAATAASAAGDPYTMAARIAANVGAVVIGFSQVSKAIKATQIPAAPKFATGGIVPGGSVAGDNVMIRANSREMILNMDQQRKLFDMIARGGGYGGGFDYDMLAKAISRMPAPVLVYREFTDFTRKIVTFDEQTKI